MAHILAGFFFFEEFEPLLDPRTKCDKYKDHVSGSSSLLYITFKTRHLNSINLLPKEIILKIINVSTTNGIIAPLQDVILFV